MGATLEDLEKFVAKMMQKEQITDYRLDVSGNTTKGDGYLGEVTFLRVFTTTEKCYNLVVKTAKKSEELRKQTPLREAYEREIFLYTKVFPIFHEYQQEKAIEKPFNNFPKCYCVSNEEYSEFVILDNIKCLDFELHDRQTPMNLNHALMMFRSYAKFHGLSLVLRHQKPALFDSLTKNMTDVFGRFFEQAKMVSGMVEDFVKVMKLLEDKGLGDVVKKYQGFQEQIEEVLTRMTNPKCASSVILHGDCWNNNMMFKYEGSDKTKPIDMRFLDFQLSRVASPVYDLSYYLYACTDRKVLQHFDFLLQAYHSTLTEFVKQFDCNIEDILSFKDLKLQWKKYGRYGLFMALFLVKIELCDPSEAPDFEDAASDAGGLNNMFDFSLKYQDRYEERMKDIYVHFAEKFL